MEFISIELEGWTNHATQSEIEKLHARHSFNPGHSNMFFNERDDFISFSLVWISYSLVSAQTQCVLPPCLAGPLNRWTLNCNCGKLLNSFIYRWSICCQHYHEVNTMLNFCSRFLCRHISWLSMTASYYSNDVEWKHWIPTKQNKHNSSESNF